MANHTWWIYECEFIQKNTVRAVLSKWNSQATCFSITWDACQSCKDTISDLRNQVSEVGMGSLQLNKHHGAFKVWMTLNQHLLGNSSASTNPSSQDQRTGIYARGDSESMVVSELNKEKGGCSRWGWKKVTGESKKMCTRDSKNIGPPGVKERGCRVTKISLNNS